MAGLFGSGVGKLATMMSGLPSPSTSATCTDCEGDMRSAITWGSVSVSVPV